MVECNVSTKIGLKLFSARDFCYYLSDVYLVFFHSVLDIVKSIHIKSCYKELTFMESV